MQPRGASAQNLSAAELEKNMRHSKPPVVARIYDDKVLIDLRTVLDDEIEELLEILSGLAKE